MSAHHLPLFAAVLPACLVLSGCLDPLVDATYHGEPLLHVEGRVLLKPPVPAEGTNTPPELDFPSGTLRLAVFWSVAPLGSPLAGVQTIEQSAVTTSVFPAVYTLTLYTPPPDAVLHTDPGGTGRYALGLVLVYVDVNNDGVWEPDLDVLVGGAPRRALMYTPEGAAGPHFAALPPGYHRLKQNAIKGCKRIGDSAYYTLDDLPTVDLHVSSTLPTDVLVDLDCDGVISEWAGTCPSPQQLVKTCADPAPAGWPCDYCGP
ncbi:MAG: hypothetical protein ACOYOB_17890 [Myxococcota bacterium]